MPSVQRLIRLAIPMLCLLMVAPAWAQDAVQPHRSDKGYSIVAPEGWEVVSGELDQQELDKLPQTIRDHYDHKTTDVMFMNLADSKDNEFKDNLNVVVLDKPVPISEDLIEELQTVLTEQYKSLFENFTLKNFERFKIGESEAVKIEANYTLLGYNLVLYQTLVSGPTRALVLTCTMDQDKRDDLVGICDKSFESVKFE